MVAASEERPGSASTTRFPGWVDNLYLTTHASRPWTLSKSATNNSAPSGPNGENGPPVLSLAQGGGDASSDSALIECQVGSVQIHLFFLSKMTDFKRPIVLFPVILCVIPGSTLDEFACTGDYESEEDCNTQACPYWTPWSDWTQCSKSCGGGQRSKVQRS